MSLSIMPSGWMARKVEVTVRPKTRLFTTLAIACAFGAAVSWPGWIFAVPLPVLAVLSAYFAKTEKPRKTLVPERMRDEGPVIH